MDPAVERLVTKRFCKAGWLIGLLGMRPMNRQQGLDEMWKDGRRTRFGVTEQRVRDVDGGTGERAGILRARADGMDGVVYGVIAAAAVAAICLSVLTPRWVAQSVAGTGLNPGALTNWTRVPSVPPPLKPPTGNRLEPGVEKRVGKGAV